MSSLARGAAQPGRTWSRRFNHPYTARKTPPTPSIPIIGTDDQAPWSVFNAAFGPVYGFRGYNTPTAGTLGVPPSWPGSDVQLPASVPGYGQVISFKPDIPSVLAGTLDTALAAFFATVPAGAYCTAHHEGEIFAGVSEANLIAMHTRLYGLFNANAPQSASYGQIVSSASAFSGGTGFPLGPWICTPANSGALLDFYGMDIQPQTQTTTFQDNVLAVTTALTGAGVPQSGPWTITEVSSNSGYNGPQAQWFSDGWNVAQAIGAIHYFPYFNNATTADVLAHWPPPTAAVLAVLQDTAAISRGDPRSGAASVPARSTMATLTSAASSSGFTLTWASNPVAGSKAFVIIQAAFAATLTVTDNGTSPTTFTEDGVCLNGSGLPSTFIFRGDNITLPATGTYAVTITRSPSGSLQAAGLAYTGVQNGPPTSTSAIIGTGNLPALDPVVPVDVSGLFISAFFSNSTANPESITSASPEFVIEQTQANGTSFTTGAVSDALVSSPAPRAGGWTLSDAPAFSAIMAAYSALPTNITIIPGADAVWAQAPYVLPGVSVNAGLASGTAKAYLAYLGVNAGLASATTYAAINAPFTATNAAARVASSTVNSEAPVPNVSPSAGLASATAAALSPYISAVAPASATATAEPAVANPEATPSASLSTATGEAPSVTIAPAAGNAQATAVSSAPIASIGATAGLAAATAGALSPYISAVPAALATANSGAPAVSLGVNAGVASATAAAYSATVTASDNATAGLASATATAYGATVTTSDNATAGVASATAAAVSPVAALSLNAGLSAANAAPGEGTPASAFVFAQLNSASGSSSYVATANATTAAGDTLLVALTADGNSIIPSSVSDSAGNVYVSVVSRTETGATLTVYQALGATGGSGGGPTASLTSGVSTITGTFSGSTTPTNLLAIDVGSCSADVVTSAIGTTGTTQSVSTGSLARAGETVVGFGWYSTYSPTWVAPESSLVTLSGNGAGYCTAAQTQVSNAAPVTVQTTTATAPPGWIIAALSFYVRTAQIADVQPSAGLASATAGALSPYISAVKFASATVVSDVPTASLSVNAGIGSATAAAEAPVISLSATAGLAGAIASAVSPYISAVPPVLATANSGAPTVSLSVNAGVASATTTAYGATVSGSANASAGVASATVTAEAPAVSFGVAAGPASSTATANAPDAGTVGNAAATAASNAPAASLSVNAGLAAATAAAFSAMASGTGVASATTTALSPSVSLSVTAGLAPATATAPAATVTGSGSATAGLAAATSATGVPAASLGGSAGFAAATTAALSPYISAVPSALATATALAAIANPGATPSASSSTATGEPAGVAISPVAADAAATAASRIPAASLSVNAGLASGIVYAAINQTLITTNAPAGLAAATGTAESPYVSAVALASATAASLQPNVNVNASAGIATATATAFSPYVSAVGVASATVSGNAPAASLSVNAGVASATAAAFSATVSGTTNAPAGLASATVTAQAAEASSVGVATAGTNGQQPIVQISATAGAADATAAANPAPAGEGVPAGLASATAAAAQPTISVVGTAYANASAPFVPGATISLTLTGQNPVFADASAYGATITGAPPVFGPFCFTGTEVDTNLFGGTETETNLYGGTGIDAHAGMGGSSTDAKAGFAGTETNVNPYLGAGSLGYGGSETETNLYGGSSTDANLYGGTASNGCQPEVMNIVIGEFNDETIDFAILNNSAAFDLTDYGLQVLLKTAQGVQDTAPTTLIFTTGTGYSSTYMSTFPGAITITNAPAGLATLVIPHVDLDIASYTFWRLDVTTSTGQQSTVIYGTVSIRSL